MSRRKKNGATAFDNRPTLGDVQKTYAELGRALEFVRTLEQGLGVREFALQESKRFAEKLSQEIGGLL